MTTGQRIAQKRKEQGLSQEGLGEQLGVSRQAIYKWESDASLPEIDKLITLSKIFSVSVGWLLGVEEDGPEALDQGQERLVEDILSRYQAALPKPRKSVWDKWSVRILFAMCGIMLALLVGTSSKVKEMERQYDNLYLSVNNVTSMVNGQIGSITGRVEEILKNQNNLTAEWSADLASVDVETNTASFDVRAVPKTYVEGMTAVFQARSGEETVELPAEPGADHAFAGRLTCPLSDEINVTVVFVTDGKRETQWLNDFYRLYSDTFPDLWIHSWIWGDEQDGVLPADMYPTVTIRNEDTGEDAWRPEPPATLRYGLFRDRKLLFWYEELDKEIIQNGTPTLQHMWNRQQEVVLEPGHTYEEAAVYTDAHGRQLVYVAGPALEYNGSELISEITYSSLSDPAGWEF